MEINGYKVLMVYKNLDRIWANFSIPSRTVTYSWKPGSITLYFQSARVTGLGLSPDYHHSRNYHIVRGWNSEQVWKPFLLLSSPFHYYKIPFYIYIHKIPYNHLLVTTNKNQCYKNHKEVNVENAYMTFMSNRRRKQIKCKSRTFQDKTK